MSRYVQSMVWQAELQAFTSKRGLQTVSHVTLLHESCDRRLHHLHKQHCFWVSGMSTKSGCLRSLNLTPAGFQSLLQTSAGLPCTLQSAAELTTVDWVHSAVHRLHCSSDWWTAVNTEDHLPKAHHACMHGKTHALRGTIKAHGCRTTSICDCSSVEAAKRDCT